MPTKKELEEIITRQQTEIERNKEIIKKKNAKYNQTIDRIALSFPPGSKERITAAAERAGKSVNAFCRDLILKAVDEAGN